MTIIYHAIYSKQSILFGVLLLLLLPQARSLLLMSPFYDLRVMGGPLRKYYFFCLQGAFVSSWFRSCNKSYFKAISLLLSFDYVVLQVLCWGSCWQAQVTVKSSFANIPAPILYCVFLWRQVMSFKQPASCQLPAASRTDWSVGNRSHHAMDIFFYGSEGESPVCLISLQLLWFKEDMLTFLPHAVLLRNL